MQKRTNSIILATVPSMACLGHQGKLQFPRFSILGRVARGLWPWGGAIASRCGVNRDPKSEDLGRVAQVLWTWGRDCFWCEVNRDPKSKDLPPPSDHRLIPPRLIADSFPAERRANLQDEQGKALTVATSHARPKVCGSLRQFAVFYCKRSPTGGRPRR